MVGLYFLTYMPITRAFLGENYSWLDMTFAKKMIENFSDEYKQVILLVQKKFKVGERYNSAYIKQTLHEIYVNKGIKRKVKTADLQEFMEVKKVKVNGNRLLEIISKNKTTK